MDWLLLSQADLSLMLTAWQLLNRVPSDGSGVGLCHITRGQESFRSCRFLLREDPKLPP